MIDLILELIRKKAGLYVKSIQQEELAVVFPQLLITKRDCSADKREFAVRENGSL